jgi:transketolase
MDVWRPCDTLETAIAWVAALERVDGPTSLICSRQNLPYQSRTPEAEQGIRRGGYVLVEPEQSPRAAIIATGSEVAIAVEAQKTLAAQGIAVRVISMPATTVFDRQSRDYREQVLPRHLPCVAVEAGVRDPWCKYVGRSGVVIGIDRFGESAPAGELFKHFGIVPERIVAAITTLLQQHTEVVA